MNRLELKYESEKLGCRYIQLISKTYDEVYLIDSTVSRYGEELIKVRVTYENNFLQNPMTFNHILRSGNYMTLAK